MATIAFAYRSTKKNAPLQVRLLYRLDDPKKRHSIYGKTKFELPQTFWEKYQEGVRFSGENKAKALELDNFKKDIADFILDTFKSESDKNTIDKEWLKKTIHEYYNPPQPQRESVIIIPNSLLGYLDYYIDLRNHELSNSELKKWNTTKRKLERFQKAEGKKFDIKDVNDNFKKNFVEYCQSESYAQNTICKEVNLIKRLCYHARKKGVEVSLEIDDFKVKTEDVKKPYLSFDDLDKIKKTDNLPDYLDNARDWLIISCYTGQRVSDFMRFNPNMVRYEKDIAFLDITQVKTGKDVTIPLLPEVTKLLDKRNGEFPRPISDVKYNVYIKEVCKRAGLNEKTKGKLAQDISIDKNKTKMRNVSGVYPKWQLATSHVGRRSFASNYYGKLPTSFLKDITGHGTEQMLLSYIGKTSKDTAFEAYKQLLNAKR